MTDSDIGSQERSQNSHEEQEEEEIVETKIVSTKKKEIKLSELSRTQGLTKSMSKVFTYHKKKL